MQSAKHNDVAAGSTTSEYKKSADSKLPDARRGDQREIGSSKEKVAE